MTLKKFETSFFFNEMRTKTIFDKQNANESQKTTPIWASNQRKIDATKEKSCQTPTNTRIGV